MIKFLTVSAISAAAVLSMSFQENKPLYQKGDFKVYEMKGSPDYPAATLRLKSPANKAELFEGKNTFGFDVMNFDLGAQTPGAEERLCANSAKGQHIHFIMDNAPYFASYEKDIVSELKPGHHVLLAFLSRSYHESIKHKPAYVLSEFKVGEAKDNFDEKAAHMFYSRPKGDYVGEKETKRLMLDFYLVNCNLSEKGYKVRATVNGNTFTVDKWAPYVIEGLALGEVKVKLELLDKNGKLVKSPFNGVERTANLKAEPAISK